MIGRNPSPFDAFTAYTRINTLMASTLILSVFQKHINNCGWLSETDIFNTCKPGHSINIRKCLFLMRDVVLCLVTFPLSNLLLSELQYPDCDVWICSCAALHSSPGPVILVTCEHQPAISNNILLVRFLLNVTASIANWEGVLFQKYTN